MSIPIDRIAANPYQTRVDFDEEVIKELSQSIKTAGLINKILVRPDPNKAGYYLLVNGERRLRACKLLGWTEIPAEIKEMSEKQAREITVIDNLQRQDLNPIEEAQGFKILLEANNSTIQSLADRLGKSRPYISNSLRLLDMPPFLRMCVLCKTLTAWQARSIMGLENGFRKTGLADLAMDWDLNVAELRAIVHDLNNGKTFVNWVRTVPVAGLYPDPNAVRIFSGLANSEEKMALKDSMKAVGQLVPITCLTTGRIIDGNTRVELAKELGWKTVKAEVGTFASYMKNRVPDNEDFQITLVNHVGEILPEREITIIPEMSKEYYPRMVRLDKMVREHLKTAPTAVILQIQPTMNDIKPEPD